MAAREQILKKIESLPNDLLREVGDFADFLSERRKRYIPIQFTEEVKHLVEEDMKDYLAGLESYEEKLAKGEIVWK